MDTGGSGAALATGAAPGPRHAISVVIVARPMVAAASEAFRCPDMAVVRARNALDRIATGNYDNRERDLGIGKRRRTESGMGIGAFKSGSLSRSCCSAIP